MCVENDYGNGWLSKYARLTTLIGRWLIFRWCNICPFSNWLVYVKMLYGRFSFKKIHAYDFVCNFELIGTFFYKSLSLLWIRVLTLHVYKFQRMMFLSKRSTFKKLSWFRASVFCHLGNSCFSVWKFSKALKNFCTLYLQFSFSSLKIHK